MSISIHASAKEATPHRVMRLCKNFDFNPRLREGGDENDGLKVTAKKAISIHASAKEATKGILPRVSLAFNFNPRLREGGDRNIL